MDAKTEKMIHDAITTSRLADATLATTIKISWEQVLEIVVRDLIENYKFNIQRDEQDWAAAFGKVLRYYLDGDEMSRLITAIDSGQLPDNPLELFEAAQDGAEAQSPEKGEVYQHVETGKKFVVLGPKGIKKASAPEWARVADRPHGDGDFSYICNKDYCRCMQ